MSIFDALANAGGDPGTMGLIGLAGGFGQAAMPTPYRGGVPLGAAIAMGAQGLGQGAKQAYATQLEQAQAQAGQMANTATASALPLTLARNKMMTDIYQNPSLMQSLMGDPQTPGASISPAPTITPAPSQATGGSSTTAGGSSGPVSKVTGVPIPSLSAVAAPGGAKFQVASSYAPQFQGLVNDLETAGYKLNPDKSGGYNDRTILGTNTPSQHALGQAIDVNWDKNPKGANLPMEIPASLANQLAQKWGMTWGGNWSGASRDPMHFEVAGASAPTQDAGAPASPQTAAAPNQSDALTQYKTLMQQAQRIDTAKALGIPLVGSLAGDPAAIRSSAQEYLKTYLAGPTAGAAKAAQAQVDLQTAGPIAKAQADAKVGADLATKGFKVGEDGNLAPIPGGPADPRLIGQQAAATALANANAKWVEPIVTRAGVVDPRPLAQGLPAKEVYRQPEYHEITNTHGQEQGAFISPNDQGGLTVQTSPAAITKLGPGQEDTIKHLADQYANEGSVKYQGALNSEYQLSQQDQNIKALTAGGGWSAPGAGNAARLGWAKAINGGFASVGLNPPFDPSKVASWEDATKLQTQLAFAQAKQLGSREAASVIEASRKATPGPENTPEGYANVSNGFHEMNNRETDLRNWETQTLQTNGGDLTGAETAFNNKFTPSMYAQRAISNVKPVAVTGPDDFAKLLPGTFITGSKIDPATGKPKVMQVPARPGAPPIPAYIQGGANVP